MVVIGLSVEWVDCVSGSMVFDMLGVDMLGVLVGVVSSMVVLWVCMFVVSCSRLVCLGFGGVNMSSG